MVDEKVGKAGVRRIVRRESLRVADVAAHQAKKLLLEPGHAGRQYRHPRKREAAQLDQVESDGIAGIPFVLDRAQPDDLDREMEAENLLTPLAVHPPGLDRAFAHRGNGLETVTGTKHVLAGLKGPDMLHEQVQVAQGGLVHAVRMAGSRECAGGTEVRRIA